MELCVTDLDVLGVINNIDEVARGILCIILQRNHNDGFPEKSLSCLE